jgi:uncharacterized protein (DUF433 family)
MLETVVSTSADIMGGTPVFPGTRVPVQTLLDYIEAGDSIEEFLRGFPTVTQQHLVAILERVVSLAVHEASLPAGLVALARRNLATLGTPGDASLYEALPRRHRGKHSATQLLDAARGSR